jgi:hypothetical protein
MKQQKIFLCLIISITTFIIYSNVINGKFLYDDEHFILRNVFITDWKYIKHIFTTNVTAGAGLKDNFYRPLSVFIWLIINKTFGLNNNIFHLVNIFVHIINSILIFLILDKFFNNYLAAFCGSMFFSVHPVNTEAVSYISGLSDPLSFCFILICISLYLSLRESFKLIQFILFIFSFILAVLAKERAVVLPALMVITEVYMRIKEEKQLKKYDYKNFNLYILYSCSVLIVILWFISRLTFLNFQNTFNFYKIQNVYSQNIFVRIFTFLNNFLKYIILIIVPYPLYMNHPPIVFTTFFAVPVIIGFITIVGLFLFSIMKIKNSPEFLFSYLWFLICLLPTSGIIPINAIFMEHWLYFSLFSVATIIAFLVSKYKKLKYGFYTIFVIFCILTYKQNFVWQEPYTFFKHILKYNPESVAANNNFAMAAEEKGEVELAIKHYKKAISLDNSFPQPHHNLARIYLSLGKVDEAINEFNEALKIDPDFIYSHIELSQLYKRLNQKEKAEYHQRKIKEILSKITHLDK